MRCLLIPSFRDYLVNGFAGRTAEWEKASKGHTPTSLAVNRIGKFRRTERACGRDGLGVPTSVGYGVTCGGEAALRVLQRIHRGR